MGFTYVSKYDYQWSTVTLCPWFIVCLPISRLKVFLLIGSAIKNYARDADFPQCGTFGEKFKGLAARALDGIVTSISYTPIDLFSLFDKVIVHEVWILTLPPRYLRVFVRDPYQVLTHQLAHPHPSRWRNVGLESRSERRRWHTQCRLRSVQILRRLLSPSTGPNANHRFQKLQSDSKSSGRGR